MGQRSGWYDSLRNFPLRLDMIEELQLNASALAAEMAIGLAILHWQTQVDGMDTELVLGSASHTPPDLPEAYTEDVPLTKSLHRLQQKANSSPDARFR